MDRIIGHIHAGITASETTPNFRKQDNLRWEMLVKLLAKKM